MGTDNQPFRISDIESFDLSRGPLFVRLGSISDSDHVAAFIDLFERVLEENRGLFNECGEITVESEHPLSDKAKELAESKRPEMLWSNLRQIGEELYFTDNNYVIIQFRSSNASESMVVEFDDPYFSLDGKRRERPFWERICRC